MSSGISTPPWPADPKHVPNLQPLSNKPDIDDLLTKVLNMGVDLGQEGGGLEPWDILTPEQALTAIYEIGLECIGTDEDPKMEYNRRRVGFNRKYLNPVQTVHNPRITVRNELKASQRKAWAKACGVADE